MCIYIYLFTTVYVYVHYIQHYYRTNSANLKIWLPSMRWPIRRSLHLPLNVGHGCELCVRSKWLGRTSGMSAGMILGKIWVCRGKHPIFRQTHVVFFFQVMADPQVTIGYHRFQQHDLNRTMTWMIRPQFGVIFSGTTVLSLELHPGLDFMFFLFIMKILNSSCWS